jgi:hypothetical protein
VVKLYRGRAVLVASDDGVTQRMTAANTVAKPLDDA